MTVWVWLTLGVALFLWLFHGTQGLGNPRLYAWWLAHLPWVVGGVAALAGFAAMQGYVAFRRPRDLMRARLMHEQAFPVRQGPWRDWAQAIRATWVQWMASRWARLLFGPWQTAGLTGSAVALLWAAAWAVSTAVFLWRPVLGGLVLALSLGLLRWWIAHRAGQQRRRFHDQLPEALDRLADALQAGFSFPQALDFIRPNLADPMRAELGRVVVHVRLGRPLEDAFETLYARYPSPEMRILVKGLNLQRRVGGDLVELLRRIAEMVRERIELEQEVRALTAQGRLSAWMIVLLIPISLFILRFFPTYNDILWNTTAGNLVLVMVALLEVAGFLVIRRILRVEY